MAPLSSTASLQPPCSAYDTRLPACGFMTVTLAQLPCDIPCMVSVVTARASDIATVCMLLGGWGKVLIARNPPRSGLFPLVCSFSFWPQIFLVCSVPCKGTRRTRHLHPLPSRRIRRCHAAAKCVLTGDSARLHACVCSNAGRGVPLSTQPSRMRCASLHKVLTSSCPH